MKATKEWKTLKKDHQFLFVGSLNFRFLITFYVLKFSLVFGCFVLLESDDPCRKVLPDVKKEFF